jgi:hypothetical protein
MTDFSENILDHIPALRIHSFTTLDAAASQKFDCLADPFLTVVSNYFPTGSNFELYGTRLAIRGRVDVI